MKKILKTLKELEEFKKQIYIFNMSCYFILLYICKTNVLLHQQFPP